MRPDWRDAIDRDDAAAAADLLDAGAEVNARDEYGQTGLMNAARDGRTAVARVLVDRGADLDVAAKYGLTALMLAVLRSHIEIVRILVDAGADLDARGTGAPAFHGKTALDLARELESIAVIEILRRE